MDVYYLHITSIEKFRLSSIFSYLSTHEWFVVKGKHVGNQWMHCRKINMCSPGENTRENWGNQLWDLHRQYSHFSNTRRQYLFESHVRTGRLMRLLLSRIWCATACKECITDTIFRQVKKEEENRWKKERAFVFLYFLGTIILAKFVLFLVS